MYEHNIVISSKICREIGAPAIGEQHKKVARESMQARLMCENQHTI